MADESGRSNRSVGLPRVWCPSVAAPIPVWPRGIAEAAAFSGLGRLVSAWARRAVHDPQKYSGGTVHRTRASLSRASNPFLREFPGASMPGHAAAAWS